MRPSPSHLLAQWLSAKFFMAMAYSLRVCSSSQCSRHIFSKSPTAVEKTEQRSVQSWLIFLHGITKRTFSQSLLSEVSWCCASSKSWFWNHIASNGSQSTVRFLQQLSETPSLSSKLLYHQSVCADSQFTNLLITPMTPESNRYPRGVLGRARIDKAVPWQNGKYRPY